MPLLIAIDAYAIMPGVKKSRLPTIANGASANKSGVVAEGKKTLRPKQKNCHHPEIQSLPFKRSNYLNESRGLKPLSPYPRRR
ncbi:hypothetical protein NPIL_525501 [Nephila pilipes]|uniref:Uncharacterized protein n=1 Tax=Nephila pilipes TaxID=299642 RepID=A0A8X6MHG2_NEPPI|nr:hypothetical protein NPIL_525501 [Nephila pilipes]